VCFEVMKLEMAILPRNPIKPNHWLAMIWLKYATGACSPPHSPPTHLPLCWDYCAVLLVPWWQLELAWHVLGVLIIYYMASNFLSPLYTRSQGQCSTQIKHSYWCKSWNQPPKWILNSRDFYISYFWFSGNHKLCLKLSPHQIHENQMKHLGFSLQ
jgi:hypothetical protein